MIGAAMGAMGAGGAGNALGGLAGSLASGGGGPSSAGSTTTNNNGFTGGHIQFGNSGGIPTWLLIGAAIIGVIYVIKKK
jgi:hypothetical protein